MFKTLSRVGQKLSDFFGEATPLDNLAFEEDQDNYFKKNFLQTLLPYRLYCPEKKIYENKSSFGFVLEVAPLLGATPFAQQELSTLIKEIGEEGASIQCLLWADHRIDPFLKGWSEPRLAKGGIFAKIAQKKVEFFRSQATAASKEGFAPPRNFRFFLSYSQPKPQDFDDEKFIDKLCEKKEKALATLKRLSSVYDVDPLNLIKALSGMINFKKDSSILARTSWDPHNFLSKQMCLPGGIEDRGDSLVFHQDGAKSTFKTYEVLEDPNEWSFGHNYNVIGEFKSVSQRIFSPFYIHYGIYFQDQGSALARIKAKSRLTDKQLKVSSIRKMFPNLPRESEEYLFAIRQVAEGEKFAQTRLTVGLWEDEAYFLNTESCLLALYQKMGYKLQPTYHLHLDEFIRNLPMVWGESVLNREIKLTRATKTTITSETGSFIPLIAEWAGNSQKGMPLIGRRGQLATWDPFETSGNYNSVVIGPSSSGKSVFMQDVMMSQLGQGGRVFVLDLGRSFERLCQLLDGQYLFFNAQSNLNLNPFNLVRNNGDEDALNASLDLVTSIVSTMAMPDRKIEKEKADIIGKAVKGAYAQKGPQATVDDIINLIEKVSFSSELMKGASESLKEGLTKFSTNGVYKNYFYGANRVDFKSDFVVIETEELKNLGDLQAVILQIFSLTIATEVFMGDREKRTLVCIDEAWDLLKSPQMEGFIEGMARRLRKYNGALMVGTQGLKDFERSPGAAAAFQNSNCLILLGRDSESVNILKSQNLIQVTPQVEMMLNSLQKVDGKYSEAFIYNKGTGFYSLTQLKLDPFSSLLYSSKPEDFKAISALKKEGYSIEKSIEKVLENRR